MKSIAVLFLAIVIMIGGLYAAIAQTPPKTPALFVVGQTYVALYSCIAQVGCYGEKITVREVRTDGWLVVDVEGDANRWFVNSASIVSVTPLDQRVAVR